MKDVIWLGAIHLLPPFVFDLVKEKEELHDPSIDGIGDGVIDGSIASGKRRIKVGHAAGGDHISC